MEKNDDIKINERLKKILIGISKVENNIKKSENIVEKLLKHVKDQEELIEIQKELIKEQEELIEIQNLLIENQNLLIENQNKIDRFETNIGSIKDVSSSDRFKKGKLYFCKGNGSIRSEKYFLVDDNLDNNYEQASYGVIQLLTKENNNFDVVVWPDNISFYLDSKTPFYCITIDDILELINQSKNI